MEEQMPIQPQPQPAPPVAPASAVTYSPAENTQPVFYSLTPEEPARPASLFKRKQIIVLAVSVVGFVLLTGLVVLFAMNAIKASNSAKQVATQKANSVQQLVAQGTSQTAAAVQVGFVDGCKGLADGPYANCVTLIASDSTNPAACSTLKDVEKTTCEDRANTALAIKNGKFDQCSKVMDETSRTGCEAIIKEKARAANNCAQFGVPEAECSATASVTALSSGNIAACDTMSPDDKATCLDGFYSVDTDKDGLSDGSELVQYHTDPKNPDTDGDGYNDGDEVATGHDPLKK